MIARDEIQYRVGGFGTIKGKDGAVVPYAMFLVYVEARAVHRDLDELYPWGWSFEWEQIEGMKWAVKGRLTVYTEKDVDGKVHEDVGTPNDQKKLGSGGDVDGEWLKDAVSDATKRCAVQVGVGRFLYDAPDLYLSGNEAIQTYKTKSGDLKFKKLTGEGKALIERKISHWYKVAVAKMSKGQLDG